MSFIYYFLSFFLIINVIVFVHEYGHFQAARKMGVKVSTFSLGMGPELFGFEDKHGTRWIFSAFPIGGYVMMLGDGDASSMTEDKESLKGLSEEEKKQSFYAKSNWAKIWIAFCGPFFNYIYAFIVIVFMSLFYGLPNYEPVVSTVMQGSPAELSGIKAGDRILYVDGKKVEKFRDVKIGIICSDKEKIKFTVERDGMIRNVEVKPEVKETKKPWGTTKKTKVVGISSGEPIYVKSGFLDSIKGASKYCWDMTVEMFGIFSRLFSGKTSIDNFGGIVQMTKVAGDLSKSGNFAQLIMFTVMLSLNLGFINLFPLPVLDGGRIFICLAEEISGKKLNEKLQEYLMIACMIFLIFLMLITTVNDILNIETISNFIFKR
ncbi:MAG: RIP metalloprotease RseP [Alphaproteobacteria bacterium]|nr:RIP metalloprotease RseP [Alphaproteobacteria bacterium]